MTIYVLMSSRLSFYYFPNYIGQCNCFYHIYIGCPVSSAYPTNNASKGSFAHSMKYEAYAGMLDEFSARK